jgi:WD40 repeat protein
MRKCVTLLGLSALLVGCQPAPVGPTTGAPPKPNPGGPNLGPAIVVPSAAALSPDGKRALVGYAEDTKTGFKNPPEGKLVKLWDMETGKLVHTLEGHDGGVRFVAFLPDGNAISAGGTSIKRWDLKTGKQVWSSCAYSFGISKAALSPDGKRLLAWGTDGARERPPWTAGLKLLDVRTGKLLRDHGSCGARDVWRITFAPKSGLAFMAFLRASRVGVPVELWDVDTGKAVESFPRDQAWKYPLAFSPDGKLALSHRLPAGRTPTTAPLSLWDLSTGREVRVFDFLPGTEPDPHMTPREAAFTPDGQGVLTVDSSGVLRTWSVAGKELRASRLGAEALGVLAFSADARRLLGASGHRRGGIQGIRLVLWDTSDGKELLTIKD